MAVSLKDGWFRGETGCRLATAMAACVVLALAGGVRAQTEAGAADPGEPVETAKGIPLSEGIKQLKRIRFKHFGQIANVEIRQLGIAKLRDFAEPKYFPHLLELFAREKQDVRLAVLDVLEDYKADQGDTAIAYAAVFDKDVWFRGEASKRLAKRVAQINADRAAGKGKDELKTPAGSRGDEPAPGLDSGVSWRVKAVIANGLKQSDDTVAAAAAELAADLRVFDLIPALINAQIQAPRGGGAGTGAISNRGEGALGYIMIGQQQAFVADLTPVVGDSAVAFDPTLGVVTSGTVLRVIDAVVVTYRTEIHYSLRRLANAGWDGRKTDGLGYDNRAWGEWYTREFLPYRKTLAEMPLAQDAAAPK